MGSENQFNSKNKANTNRMDDIGDMLENLLAEEEQAKAQNAPEAETGQGSSVLAGGGRAAKSQTQSEETKKERKAREKQERREQKAREKEEKKNAKKEKAEGIAAAEGADPENPIKAGKKKKKKSNKRLVIALVIVLVMVIALGGVIVAGLSVVHDKLDKVSKVQVNTEALGIDDRVAEELKNYRNIALLGIDARNMDDDSNTRSDAMIIASVNKTTNEVKLVSLYRDTYVSLGDNFGLDKMTHAYFYGGAAQTLQTINRNLDLNCAEAIVVNWKSVADTVDQLGGLDIEIKESEIKEMNKYIKDTQKNIGGSKKKIKKAGMQTLNGNQAVTYARIRKDSADGDHRRNERMKIVLEAAFEKAKTLSLSELNRIADEILPTIKTNMSTSQMMEMLLQINAYNITESKNWPYKSADWMHNSIYYGPPVTLKSNVIQLHEEFFGQEDYQPTETVEKISDSISSITGMW